MEKLKDAVSLSYWTVIFFAGMIEEAYPSYLQDAFFGRPLLDIPSSTGLNLSDEEDTDEVGFFFFTISTTAFVI